MSSNQSNAKIVSTFDADKPTEDAKDTKQMARFHYNPSQAPRFEDEQDTLILSPSNHQKIKAKRSFWFRMAQTLGILGSIAWATICFAYMLLEGGIATQTPYELGIFVAGMLAPVAFYWMLLSYLQRNSDVQYYAESLRAELHTLFFPSEDDSHRVNKDIERMTMQAAEFAASSKAALKSIHRTRQGLRSEIKEFANFAQKAETHLSNLSDNLMARASEMNKFVDTIENRVEVINDKSKASITIWDDASAKIVERASDIETTFINSSSRVMEVAEIAEDKSKAVSEMFDGTITSLGLTVDAVIDRLGNINNEFGGYTRTIQISTEELAKETNRMGAMIDDHIDQMQNAAGRSVETITQSLVSVSEQNDAMEDIISMMTEKASIMVSAISGATENLNKTADNIVGRAEATGEKLAEKSTMIAESLDGLAEQINRIDSMSELANHRLGEGVESAMSGATQVNDAIRRGVDLLNRAAKESTLEATAIIEATISHIGQLKDIGQGNAQSIESMVGLLEQSRIQIEKASVQSASQVDMLTQAIDTQSNRLELSALTLGDSVKSIARAVEEPLRQVSVAVADADTRHEQISATLERRVVDLKEASTKATESVEIIRQSLREQTQDISSLSGRVVSQAKTLNEELSKNKEFLKDTIQVTLDDMNRLMNDLSNKTNTIASEAGTMMGALTKATQTIDVTANRLVDTAAVTQQALDQSGEAFTSKAQLMESVIIKSDRLINEAHQKLNISCETLLPLYDRVEKQSQKSSALMESMRSSYIETSDMMHSKIETAGIEFEKRLNQLQDGTANVTSILKSTTLDLRDKLSDIEYAASGATEKMRGLSSAMEGQSADIHILTDQAILKVENIQKLLGNQYTELTGYVDQAVSKIEGAGLAFDSHAEKISNHADIILDRFTTAGEVSLAKANELKSASLDVTRIAHESVDQISTQMTLLRDNSDDALMNLRKTSDTLSIKSREIDSMMQSVLGQVKSYGDDMRSQVAAVAAQSDESVQNIGQSLNALTTAMSDVNNKTKESISFIADTNQSLYEQSGRFVTAVAKSAQAAEHASELFSEQANNLLKSSHMAVEKAQEIRKAELRAGRETFMSSARFVLESLHSLSIDFVRMIDGDVAQTDWKSYQKGDISVFTSKLVARLGEIPADKIRNKYAEDSEFRNYVQKFMRQFEDVLEQTDSVDRGAILGTTFAASDVGKIYRFLSNVTGRENKIAA